MALKSFVSGQWKEGRGKPVALVNPATEETVAEVSREQPDFKDAVAFARHEGGRALRQLTFAARGELCRHLAKVINDSREELLALAVSNGGNTRSDAKFDVDGASATLMYYAELGQQLGDVQVIADGEGVPLGRSARLYGHHVQVPRHGVALHINAFNFPAWGMAEKLAVSILCGVPVITKPATATAVVAHRMAEKWVEAAVLPLGAFSFIAGSIGNVVEQLSGQDVLAFTGSGGTAAELRCHPALARENVHVNVEADSLNAAVLGPDVALGTETFGMFLSDVAKEMTQKTGQKCTAVRRIYVPREQLGAVRDELAARLTDVRVGNPVDEQVTMGPVATASQLREVRAGIARLAQGAEVVIGGAEPVDGLGAPAGKGYFIRPTLLLREAPQTSDVVNAIEVFGPVATLMPYRTTDELCAWVTAGAGGLVSSVYSDDRRFVQDVVMRIAPYHGRITLGSEKVAGQTIPPGMVMPQLLHGGPGRAGGGEELGGRRGMALYLQRVALQGHRAVVEQLIGTPASATKP